MATLKNYFDKENYLVVNKLADFNAASKQCLNFNSSLASTIYIKNGKVQDEIFDENVPYKFYRIGLQFMNGMGTWVNDINTTYDEQISGKLRAFTDRQRYKKLSFHAMTSICITCKKLWLHL